LGEEEEGFAPAKFSPAAEPGRGRAAGFPALRLAWFQATIADLGGSVSRGEHVVRGEKTGRREKKPTRKRRRPALKSGDDMSGAFSFSVLR
jgi:hypothetical protein